MSTHNIGFYEDLTKIIFELSSNMHLISSAVIALHFSYAIPQTTEYVCVWEGTGRQWLQMTSG